MKSEVNMLSDELKRVLHGAGAKLTGFACMTGVQNCAYPYGAAVAVPIPPHIVTGIEDGPTAAYYDMYHALNGQLNAIVTAGAEFLKARGYTAVAQTTDYVKQDGDHRTALPHKTVAIRAGLGWIGRSCLLVTEEYGSAIRISSLLTGAPLDVNRPILASGCGGCKQCVIACPARALSGETWDMNADRGVMLDADSCEEKQFELMKTRTGIDAGLCGKCFAICPFTRRYIVSEGAKEEHDD